MPYFFLQSGKQVLNCEKNKKKFRWFYHQQKQRCLRVCCIIIVCVIYAALCHAFVAETAESCVAVGQSGSALLPHRVSHIRRPDVAVRAVCCRALSAVDKHRPLVTGVSRRQSLLHQGTE